jgi:hypothetical protein
VSRRCGGESSNSASCEGGGPRARPFAGARRAPGDRTPFPAAPPSSRHWDALPPDATAHVLLLLGCPKDRAAASLACRAWAAVLAAAVHELRGVPWWQLPRALRRFPRASSVALLPRGPTRQGASVDYQALADAGARALAECPRAPRHLSVCGATVRSAAKCVVQTMLGEAPPAPAAAWLAGLSSLEIQCRDHAPSLPTGLGAATPGLRRLSLKAIGHGRAVAGLAGCVAGLPSLHELALEDVWCSALPGLGAAARLTRLEVADAHNLLELPAVPPCLEVRYSGSVGRMISKPSLCCVCET